MSEQPTLRPLREVLSRLRTGPFGSAVHKYDYIEGGRPLINPMHIVGGSIRPSQGVSLRPEKAAELTDFELKVGDVILGRRGEMGRCALVTEKEDGWIIGTGSMALTTSSALRPDYLCRFLSSPLVIAALERDAVGSTMVNLNQQILLNLPIAVPPLAEQLRIVTKLDALTACLTRARAELERGAALARQLRNASLSTARKATFGYPLLAISQLVSTSFDGPFGSNLKSDDYTREGAQVIRLENIGHLRFIEEKKTYVSLEKYGQLTRHTLNEGDILFSSFVDQEVRVCCVPKSMPGPTINKADCFALRVDEAKCSAKFLAYILAAPETYEHMREAVHGATRPRVGLSQLRNYKVHLPDLEQQRILAAQIDAVFARTNNLEAKAARILTLLGRLEAAILAKTFRGELVPQDPADEPASVLLERVRARQAAAPALKRKRLPKGQAALEI